MKLKEYYSTIQECGLFEGGTNLTNKRYNIEQVFQIIHQAKKEVFDEIARLKKKQLK